MKKKSSIPSSPARPTPELKEAAVPYGPDRDTMVRTQIYLSKAEYDFVQSEARRRDEPMASVIRGFIDERMRIPEHVWKKSPLLDPPADPDYRGPEDAGINHDHHLYGGPRKYKKMGNKWVWQPRAEK